ncbi:hypothetical protein HDV05_002368 [Chytridiales sp. JEL 0842]|nr:hypothetical protein HDV05_002368 [Chytridiales sp. JEL 0842]
MRPIQSSYQRNHSTATISTTSANPQTAEGPSVDPQEIRKFSQIASTWWDPRGPFGLLHAMNPVRVGYVRDWMERCGVSPNDYSSEGGISGEGRRLPWEGLRMLDVGCGGGLLSESLARLGASVTGIDASPENIQMATLHARSDPLLPSQPTYRAITAEKHVEEIQQLGIEENQYDVVCALEILEHVTDPGAFVKSCAELLKPNGLLFLSTINRTPASYLFTILVAEHILKWVPPNTHEHDKYITIPEAQSYVNYAGCDMVDITGIEYKPLTNNWGLVDKQSLLAKAAIDLQMNYILCARKRSE